MIKINQSEWLKGSRDFFDQSNDRNFSAAELFYTNYFYRIATWSNHLRTEFQLTLGNSTKNSLKFFDIHNTNFGLSQRVPTLEEVRGSSTFSSPVFLILGPIPVWHLPDNGSWKEQSYWMSDQLVLNLSLESSLFSCDNNGCFEMSSARIPVLRQVSQYFQYNNFSLAFTVLTIF